MPKFKYRYYLIFLLALISVFLFSCSDHQTSNNQQDPNPPPIFLTKLNPPTSSLNSNNNGK